jgi:hypothetical protein
MIAIPLWLASNWKIGAGVIAGALLCWPVASCHGESQAGDKNALRMEVAAEKARSSAARAEAAANRADLARQMAAQARNSELQGIVNHEGTNAVVGGAVGAVIGKLRSNAGGKDKPTR